MRSLRSSVQALVALSALAFGAAIAPSVRAQQNDAWSTGPVDGTFTGLNWTLGTTTPGGPGGMILSGDSLYFGMSSIVALNENETAGFSIGGFTFNADASAFTITGNSFALGTGGVTNNSANVQTINDAFTLAATSTFTTTAGGGDLALGGAISGAGGMTFGGAGTTTLSGALSYTGVTTLNSGILTITGTGTVGSATGTVGINVSTAAGQSSTLNFASTGTIATAGNLTVGGGSAASVGVVNQTAGTVTISGGNLYLANDSGAYGAYNMSGGMLNVSTIRTGGANSGSSNSTGNAYIMQTGGTINTTSVLLGRGNAGSDVYYLNGGTVNTSSSFAIGVAAGQYNVVTVNAGTLADGGFIYLGGGTGGTGAAGTGILNLNGGFVSAQKLVGQGNTNIVNFNGGTLQAAAGATAQAPFTTGLTSANVYSGGAKIDSNGNNITFSQLLLTTAGTTGITNLALGSGGSGYIGAPVVTISNTGSGKGATAIANLDASGHVSSITITSVGTGYDTGTTSYTLSGGTSGTAATAGTITTGLNAATDGGLTKIGTGTLTLSGQNTFNGPVLVSAGTLIAGSAANDGSTGSLGLSNTGKSITVSTGATLTLSQNTFGNQGNTGTLPTITVNGGTLGTTRYTTVGALVLNGANVTSTSSDNSASYQALALRGNVTVGGTSASTISSTNVGTNTGGYHLGANTTFNVADATGDANPDLTVSAPLINQSGDFANAAGGLTKAGVGTMALTATNTYTGATTVNAGTLLVNGSTASASMVTVNNSGSVLGGTGTISGATTINAGSKITGADVGTVGTLNLSSTLAITGGTYVVDINSTTADKLTITGALSLSGANISFNGTPMASSYVLATFASVNNMFAGTAPSGYAFQYHPTELDLVAVPEPVTWVAGLLLVGSAGVSLRRRITGWLGRVRG